MFVTVSYHHEEKCSIYIVKFQPLVRHPVFPNETRCFNETQSFDSNDVCPVSISMMISQETNVVMQYDK